MKFSEAKEARKVGSKRRRKIERRREARKREKERSLTFRAINEMR